MQFKKIKNTKKTEPKWKPTFDNLIFSFILFYLKNQRF